jgi:hypothetical protein
VQQACVFVILLVLYGSGGSVQQACMFVILLVLYGSGGSVQQACVFVIQSVAVAEDQCSNCLFLAVILIHFSTELHFFALCSH